MGPRNFQGNLGLVKYSLAIFLSVFFVFQGVCAFEWGLNLLCEFRGVNDL